MRPLEAHTKIYTTIFHYIYSFTAKIAVTRYTLADDSYTAAKFTARENFPSPHASLGDFLAVADFLPHCALRRHARVHIIFTRLRKGPLSLIILEREREEKMRARANLWCAPAIKVRIANGPVYEL